MTHLSVDYGDVHALDDVNLTLQSGKLCALVGVNGSGKSTLLKSILGLVKPTTGTITIGGLNPARARAAGRIAYVPQNEDVDTTFPISVEDIVISGRQRHMGFLRRPRKADKNAVDQAIEMVGLTDLRHRQIGALSGGQRKRAFVARGIAQDAQLLLFDEPFAGVDHASEQTIRTLMRGLATRNKTLLVATHDLAGLSTFADEALLLAGRVLIHDTPDIVCTPEILAQVFGIVANKSTSNSTEN
ncbi:MULTISPECIES: metal ABC transporter ATP-binding protein [unclassified Schaalia]|uniref:metal ABC transporter ATP-binding protein n=1 Tax=unclassified Schaalia TaxID=2691889 RepID=UPI001E381A12|nr:metal ABC transporter ATP-binding protein [Schaalia sp. lx-260]MCD4557224.1 metal ABC transporter ATP-binding protein [Schaalia sp. lx-100]